jgi:hypothetical protein
VAIKERFKRDEWELLKILPFQVFILVAASDANVDSAEVEQFQRDMSTAAMYKDVLHRELMLDVVQGDMQSLLKKAMDTSTFTDRMRRMKSILQARLTMEEYQRFVASVFIDGLKIARASGGRPAGEGANISEDEKRALVVLAALFDLDINSLPKYYG